MFSLYFLLSPPHIPPLPAADHHLGKSCFSFLWRFLDTPQRMPSSVMTVMITARHLCTTGLSALGRKILRAAYFEGWDYIATQSYVLLNTLTKLPHPSRSSRFCFVMVKMHVHVVHMFMLLQMPITWRKHCSLSSKYVSWSVSEAETLLVFPVWILFSFILQWLILNCILTWKPPHFF